MRAPPLIRHARHYGMRAYEHARNFSTGVSQLVDTTAHLYGEIIQPILRSQGVDTTRADRALVHGYSRFDEARAVAQRIDGIVQR